jgi:hypothetical protein
MATVINTAVSTFFISLVKVNIDKKVTHIDSNNESKNNKAIILFPPEFFNNYHGVVLNINNN